MHRILLQGWPLSNIATFITHHLPFAVVAVDYQHHNHTAVVAVGFSHNNHRLDWDSYYSITTPTDRSTDYSSRRSLCCFVKPEYLFLINNSKLINALN